MIIKYERGVDMSRIAAKIKEARIKAKITEKELAKKCGLTASYIIQIESGKKVVNEKVAENILEVLGEKLEFMYQEDKNEEKPVTPTEKKRKNNNRDEFYTVEPTEQWSDALANIIKKFPIYETDNNKIVGYKELPVLGKKIDGYSWDKVLFIKSPDNKMEVFRIKKDDIITIHLTSEIQNNCIYLFEINNKKMIRQLRKESNNKVIISTGVKGEDPDTTELSRIKVIGKCIKVEFELG